MSAPAVPEGSGDPDGSHNTVDPDEAGFEYDEFAWFGENCAEYDLPWDGQVEVRRVDVSGVGGSGVSMLRWGQTSPEVVFLHGSAQNAHTWDTVNLALRPGSAVAIDLPGHGRSPWRGDSRYDPHTNAETVAEALASIIDRPVVLVGMSLGGLTANRLAALVPDMIERLVVVDITPGVTQDKAKEIHDFIAGPQSFASFTEIFERTLEFNPTRSPESLRRGILHNAHRLPDGSWEWNYDRAQPDGESFPERAELWADVASTSMPYMLVRGGDSPVVDDDDVAELCRQRPQARVELVESAGHSIQGDQPLVLAALLGAELAAARSGG